MRNPMIDQAATKLTDGLGRAKSLGASEGKLTFMQSESTLCKFSAGRLKDFNSSQSIRYDVEVLVDGKLGYATGNDFDAMDEIIRRAVTLAKVGSRAHFEKFPTARDVPQVRMHSERTLALTREQMIDAGQSIVQKLKNYNSDLFIEASAGKKETEEVIVTSGGVQHQSCDTGWSLGGMCQRTLGTDILFAGAQRSWKDLNEYYDPDYIADRTLLDLKRGEEPADPIRGKMPAVFPPHTVGMLLHAVSLGVNGRLVAKGDSPLEGRIGEQLMDERISVIDDPVSDFVNGAREISDEGIPVQRLPIIENGVLRSFLYDLDSAGLAGAEPTGHDGCSPYSLLVPGGEKASDELIADIDDGIYVNYLMGFGQGNILNGDFSCNVGVGYRIKDGKFAGRVKNTMVAGNVYELLKSNVQLSSDGEPTDRMPYMVVDGLSVISG
ncbi:MAG: TldD/PmbA family protein [Phycisphaerae bacterium]